jgi:hypothetical protein
MKNGSYFPGRGTLAERMFLEGKSQGLAEGRAEGLAETVLLVLHRRRIAVSDEIRDRILLHRDCDELKRWMRLSTTVTAADQIFEDTV